MRKTLALPIQRSVADRLLAYVPINACGGEISKREFWKVRDLIICAPNQYLRTYSSEFSDARFQNQEIAFPFSGLKELFFFCQSPNLDLTLRGPCIILFFF